MAIENNVADCNVVHEEIVNLVRKDMPEEPIKRQRKESKTTASEKPQRTMICLFLFFMRVASFPGQINKAYGFSAEKRYAFVTSKYIR